MRICRLLSLMTLALVPAVAFAQAAAPPTPANPPGTGTIDVGVRGTGLSGDAARYDRYRDLRSGAFLEGLRWDVDKSDWRLSFGADHTGWRDQRFQGGATKPGRMKAWFLWDQIPMLMSTTTRTLFREDFSSEPSVLTIDPALRAQIQATSGATPNINVIPGLFAQNARTFDTRGRRHIAQGGVEYLATTDLTVRATYQRSDRQGVMPYGGAFGHSSLVELPAPIKHTLNDFESSAEFSRDRVLLRAGYTGSWFHNENTTVTFDNPFRTFDSASAPSRGRLSQAPSSTFYSVNGLASIRLPYRSRVTWYVSAGSLKDAGDPLMGQTINTATTTLTALDRTRVEGEARTYSTNLAFSSRPNRYVDFSARFRVYDYDNRTPEFAMTQRVAYDNTPGVASMSTLGGVTVPFTTNPIHTEPFGVVRHTLDADVRVTPINAARAGLGFTRLTEERSHRFFERTTENVVRVTFDSTGNQWFSLRTKYEHAERRGDVTDEAQRELFGIGEQPGIRHFDIASRDRDRVTLLGMVMPRADLAFTASVAAGKDDYSQSLFGLRDNTHRVYSIGADATPSELFNVGLSYSFERYKALSRSRQANPPSGAGVISYETFLQLSQLPSTTVQVADASRNWASDGTDRVHSFILSAGVNQIAGKVDLLFTFDTNHSEALYNYITGPVADRTLPDEVVVDSTLTNCNTPNNCKLPPVTSRLDRGTADLTYWITQRFGVGLSYWHERYRVTDFTLDSDANPDLVRSQAMLLGYLYRPYTANTVWGRLFVRW